MQGSWVSSGRDDECMDNKIYSESLIENILPTNYLYGHNQCQVQFYKSFSSLQLNWDSLFCISILGEISEVSSTWNKPFMVNVAILNQRSCSEKSFFLTVSSTCVLSHIN